MAASKAYEAGAANTAQPWDAGSLVWGGAPGTAQSLPRQNQPAQVCRSDESEGTEGQYVPVKISPVESAVSEAAEELTGLRTSIQQLTDELVLVRRTQQDRQPAEYTPPPPDEPHCELLCLLAEHTEAIRRLHRVVDYLRETLEV